MLSRLQASNSILESPFEPQHIALIAESGKHVSLSEIHLDCMAYIESQIIGCSPTRGISDSYLHKIQKGAGCKIIYYLITPIIHLVG